jgi:hypothetical protein
MYRHCQSERFEIHINGPLRRVESPYLPFPSDGPQVFITTAWINATTSDASRASGRSAVPEEDQREGQPEEPDEPEEQDDSDDGEMTAEGLNNLYTRASQKRTLG